MSRFTSVTFNTGSIAAGGHFDHDVAASFNNVDIAKIKVIPSGSTVGYVLELFKKATRLSVDRQYATKTNVIGNYYDPTDRQGNEILEGWVLPYEDLDAGANIHTRVTNNDAVARSYDVTIEFETALSKAAPLLITPVAFSGLPGTPAAGMIIPITDSNTATFGATITAGGGGNKGLAYYDGTNWTFR